MAANDAYELAYRAAVRALDHQMAAVTELRGRAGVLLATASITVSLLGPRAFSGRQPFGGLALASFALLSICVLAIVWPRVDWRFDADPHAFLIAHLAAEGGTTDALYLSLIAHMAKDRSVNARHLAHVALGLRVGASLLVIQILSTVAATSTVV